MTQTTTRTDADIQRDVLNELKWDTRVDETEIGVSVQQGIVTLTGWISSWGKKIAARDAAHRVRGVLDVADDLEVRWPGTPGKTDAEIAQAVRHALEWDVFVPHQRIRTTVTKGLVTLEGEVDFESQRLAAARAIRNLEGVAAVTNTIRLVPAEVAPDTVRRAIQGALARRSEREAKLIQLDVRDGTAILSGKVNSWADREAVLGAARGTSGVRKIEDHLRIDPYA
jgi:osmotically-inducible protein OsmY